MLRTRRSGFLRQLVFASCRAAANELEFGDAFGPIGMNRRAAALEKIEGLRGFGLLRLGNFAEFAARVHTMLSEYSTGGLSVLRQGKGNWRGELCKPLLVFDWARRARALHRSSVRVGECPLICPADGPACLKSGHEKDSGGLECNQGRQITTQFERDARRGAQRNTVGLRRDDLTDPMMEPAVSNTTLGCPKYCIFCIQPSQQGAYQRP